MNNLFRILFLGIVVWGLTLPALAEQKLVMKTITTDHGTFHYTVIRHDGPYIVKPGVSDTLMGIEKFSTLIATTLDERLMLPALINAGFFDPANQETISYVTLDSKLALDPTLNKRLSGNESLAPYLPKVFNRSEFRTYQCGRKTRYAITRHNDKDPSGCTLLHALAAGPMLMPHRLDQEEAFIDYDANHKMTRNPIGVDRRDARSAVAVTCKGDVILAMGEQLPEKSAGTGFTLSEMAAYLDKLGAVQALNLDGGSSSGIQVEGVTTYGKYKDGQPVRRPVKSFLMVVPR